jgi:hypothetical protein
MQGKQGPDALTWYKSPSQFFPRGPLHPSFFRSMYQRMDINYDTVFWIGAIAFLITSVTFWVGRMGDVGYVFYIQVVAGAMMFTGSKIGRAFLGLK